MIDVGSQLVLSLFPGVGLLDRAFEEEGFVVVRGPDLIFGGDVRRFRMAPGHVWGIIGGPPCQDFSSARRAPPTGYGLEMLEEYCRIVREARPEWYLCENVSRVPTITIDGYHGQRLDVDQRWFADVSRLRHIQFGSRSGRMLQLAAPAADPTAESGEAREIAGAALASDSRSLAELVRLQGLPDDFELPSFTITAAKRAVGNGVPLPMGRALARAVVAAYSAQSVTLQRTLDGGAEPHNVCACGCGRRLAGRQSYHNQACRKRAQRKRDAAVAETSAERVSA